MNEGGYIRVWGREVYQAHTVEVGREPAETVLVRAGGNARGDQRAVLLSSPSSSSVVAAMSQTPVFVMSKSLPASFQ